MLRSGRAVWRVALGTLVLQAAFNTERRQALGCAAALAPLASRWPAGEPRRRFLLRHLENFNTNPAFAGPILGAVARLEERAAAGDENALLRIPRLKRALEGPFASTGDGLLWLGVRPAVGAWASVLAWAGGAWGALAFLIAYNLVHLGFRVGGVFWGHARGEDVVTLLRSSRLVRAQMFLPALHLAGALLLGGLAFGAGAPRAASLAGVGGTAVGLLLGRRAAAHGTLIALGAMMLGLVAAQLAGSGP